MKKILYHGTNRDFKKFNRYTEDETNLLQEIFFTDSYEEAKDYAYTRVEDEEAGTAKVLTVEIEMNNIMTGNLEEDFKSVYKFCDKDDIELMENLKAEFNGNDTLDFFTFCAQAGKAFEDECSEKDINDSFFKFDSRQQDDDIYTSLNADNCKIINVEILEELDY